MAIETWMGFFQRPGERARKSKQLRIHYDHWIKDHGGKFHLSPSGMTAYLFAQWALQDGYEVRLQLHSQHGVVVTLQSQPEYDWRG